MKGIRSRVVVALVSSTLLASGLAVAALVGSTASAAPAIAGRTITQQCSDITFIEYCSKG